MVIDVLKRAFTNTIKKNPYYVTGMVAKDVGTKLAQKHGIAPPQVLSSTINRTSGSSGTTTSSGSSQDPTDMLRSAIQDKWNTLNSVFNTLFGDVDNTIRSRSEQLLGDYSRQEDELGKSYARTAEELPRIFGARGAGSSSYFQNELQDALGIFEGARGDLQRDKEGKLAQLGQFGATTKARYGSSRDALGKSVQNVGSYDASQLASLDSQLQDAIGSAELAQAGLGSDQEFIQGLSKVSPIQQQGSATLANRLKTLVQSAAPIQAKKYIAQGLIKSATLDDANASNYWSNYFEQLLAGGV